MKTHLLMYINFIIFSLGSAIASYAGFYPLISFVAIGLYALSFGTLAIYAILWQQVLKKMPLSVAFISKTITIPLGMLWGWLLFGEVINLNMIIGVIVIVAGVIIMIRGENHE